MGDAIGMASQSGEPDLLDLVNRAEAAALAAGEMLMRRPPELQVSSKSSATDVVTDMDRRSERLLVQMLLDGRPDDGVLGEEGADRASANGVRWVIDPIDGTVNYLYDLPIWAVSVGVEVDGVAVAGVVRVPSLGETYLATRGGGAICRTATGDRILQVSNQTELTMALIATGFGYEVSRRRAQGRVVAQLLPSVREIRRAGSAAVDLCWLAAGRVDGFYERGLHEWDHCAAGLIAQEAGAMVGGLRGAAASGELLMAANPTLFPALHDLLVDLDADRD